MVWSSTDDDLKSIFLNKHPNFDQICHLTKLYGVVYDHSYLGYAVFLIYNMYSSLCDKNLTMPEEKNIKKTIIYHKYHKYNSAWQTYGVSVD